MRLWARSEEPDQQEGEGRGDGGGHGDHQPRVGVAAGLGWRLLHDDEEYLFHVLRAGACGYILKSANDLDLVNAIRTVARGDAYLYPSATRLLIQEYLDHVEQGDESEDYHILTDREQEILVLTAKGYSNKEIADQLVLSVKTVETHKAHVMEKLHLKTRPELVRYALKKGLLDFE